MAYNIPDCSNPEIRARLPESLCNFSPEVIEQICQRQPSLCQPYPAAEPPSIWEPIVGTAQDVIKPFENIWTGTGQTVLGVGQLALALPQIISLGLIVYGLFLITDKRR